MQTERKRTRKQRWWPFVLLCVLTISRWTLWEQAGVGSSALTAALGCGSACVLMLTLVTRKRSANPGAGVLLQAAISGAMMLAGPVLALLSHQHGLDEGSLTMALALVPVVVAVARPAFRMTEGANLAGRLWPGIAAIAGLLLLLPEPPLGDTRRDIILFAMPLAAGLGAAWLRAREGNAMWRAAAALGGATVLFFASAVFHGDLHDGLRMAWLGAAFDGVLALLSVLALLRLGATRWSGQYALLPLAAIAEGLIIMRAKVDPRSLIGMALLLLATVFLLLPPKTDDASTLGLGDGETRDETVAGVDAGGAS